MGHHTDQFATALRRAVQEILSRGLNDPRVRGLISVTRVVVSPDLRNATIFVSILPADGAALAMHGLRNAKNHVRFHLKDYAALRHVPELRFELDDTIKREAAVFAAIDKAKAATENASEMAADDENGSAAPEAATGETAT